MNIAKKIASTIDYVENVFLYMSGGCLMLVMIFTTTDVIIRKIFGFSIPSLFEFTEDYLMIGVIFLSLSYVYKLGGHVRVTLVADRLPSFIIPILNIITDWIGLILFSLIGYCGWTVAIRAFMFNEISSSLLAYPVAPALFLVPLGAFMMCIRIILTIIQRHHPRPDEGDEALTKPLSD